VSLVLQDKAAMQRGWNARASRDPFFYVETTYWDGDVDRFFELGEDSARRLIDPIRQRFGTSSGIALDLGCGLGRFSRALARRFSSVVAVDVSDRMIAEARRLQAGNGSENITFKTGDGVTLPASDNAIDFVWSYEVFQHIPTHETIRANIAEVSRVLRPGGLAMIHLKTGYQRPALHAVIRHLPQWAVTLAVRIAGKDPLMGERTFRGSPPMDHKQIEATFSKAGLTLLEIANDPTHSPGTRAFALATKRAASSAEV
jgi:ubiquinone/menaquinone biosynthesis C-methylase UbiE